MQEIPKKLNLLFGHKSNVLSGKWTLDYLSLIFWVSMIMNQDRCEN